LWDLSVIINKKERIQNKAKVPRCKSEKPLIKFRLVQKMIMFGLGQTGKGMVSFLCGSFFAGTGNWIPGNWGNMLARSVIRQIISFIPQYYLDNTFIKFD
jgi:hypothetical protein